MALAARVDAHGYLHCDRCGVRFKRRHSCRAPLGEYMPRRPEGFADLVEESAQEHRAEQAAAAQLSLDDLAAACTRCGPTDVSVDEDSGLCTSCMAEDARALAGRVAGFYRASRRRGPP